MPSAPDLRRPRSPLGGTAFPFTVEHHRRGLVGFHSCWVPFFGAEWRGEEDFALCLADEQWKAISHEARFDSGTLSLYLAMNRRMRGGMAVAGTVALFGKGFRAPPLRALSPMLTEAGKEGQAPLTGFGATLLHQ
ncbi:hypothetical protein Nepgr_029622 [Nepenthes gracilis]|uniref:Uncharacterized protein n=1 Tax=Nepenthes gracilis TaxID=150966 RepID=A0AAD3Y596_NEPGR|nr:hypothetical protein Nepgr_029622 [Nepenthes gracilis]